jgi:hypothetical protein
VRLHMMTGEPAEVRRAVAVLEQAVTETGGTVRRPGRRPAKPALELVPGGQVEASRPGVSDVSEAEDRSRRRRRQKYREAAGADADGFEQRLLARLGPDAPEHARAADKSAEYWRWLLEQYSAERGGQS